MAILAVLLVIGTALRCQHLSAPLTDMHSWNQTSAATVARHLRDDPDSLLQPRWNVLAHASRAPQYGAEEFPIYHLLVAFLAPSPQTEALIVTGRVTSILFGLLGVLALWKLIRRRLGIRAADAAAIVFYLSPMALFFGRTFASDTLSLSLSVLALERIDLFLSENRKSHYWSGVLAITFSSLAKPYHLVLLLPLAALYQEKKGWAFLKNSSYWLLLCLPLFAEAAWLSQAVRLGNMGGALAEGESFLSNRLFGPLSLLIEFRYWHTIALRIWEQLLTPIPAGILLLGLLFLLTPRRAYPRFLPIWLAATLIYLLIVRQGNLVHNYYQYLLLPPLAAQIGWSWQLAFARLDRARFLHALALGLLMLSIAYFGSPYVQQFHRCDISAPTAGNLVQKHSLPGDRIIVWEPERDRKPQLFFYAEREGWFFRRLTSEDLETHRQLGAGLLVINLPLIYFQRLPADARPILSRYRLLAETTSLGRSGEKRIIRLYDLRTLASEN